MTRAKIITLCGSTKFKEDINKANARLTMQGNVVISLGVFGHTDIPDVDWTTGGNAVKRMLDDLHKQKIDLADEIYVINPGGYIG
jgi:predicted phosphodiesterase